MAGTNWTVFQPNTKIISSEVNENFDWMEGSIVPMNAGSKTDGVYDLAEDANRFRSVYLRNGIFDMDATITSSEIFSVTTGSGNLFKVHGTTDAAGIIDTPLQSGCRYSNPTLTANTLSAAPITFETEVYDNQNEYDTSDGTFTVTKDGNYNIMCDITFDTASTQTSYSARMDIIRSDSNLLGSTDFQMTNYNRYQTHQVVCIGSNLTAGQSFEVKLYRNTTGVSIFNGRYYVEKAM